MTDRSVWGLVRGFGLFWGLFVGFVLVFFVVCLVGRTLIYERSPLNKPVSNENCKTNNNSMKISPQE